MRVVIAPDSFKECLSASDVCRAIAEGWRAVFTDAELDLVPMADGGEGTVDALVSATGGMKRSVVVTGPLGERVEAAYGVLGDGTTAVIEMATASGLGLVPPERLDPRMTTTRRALFAATPSTTTVYGATPPSIWKAFALAALPMALILKEPDLGTALVFVPITMAMLFTGGASWRPLLALIVAGALAVTALLSIVLLPEMLDMRPERQEALFHRVGLSHYQRDRIEVFLRPDSDPLGAGWNRRQSEIAIGSGGMWGRGYMQGRQNLLGFLPRTVSPTDFIFAVIAEETGFAGDAALLGLYVVLLGCGLMAALQAPDLMGRVLCVGITTLIFSHVFINVAMTGGLLPVTGIPLPLVSYGGTFLVSTLFTLGLVQSVHVRKAG